MAFSIQEFNRLNDLQKYVALEFIGFKQIENTRNLYIELDVRKTINLLSLKENKHVNKIDIRFIRLEENLGEANFTIMIHKRNQETTYQLTKNQVTKIITKIECIKLKSR